MTEREYLIGEQVILCDWLDGSIDDGQRTYDETVADGRYIHLQAVIERIRVLDTPRVEIVTEEGS